MIKTLTLEQLKTIGRELAMGSQGGWNQSKEFLDLVKSIGESRSMIEEDRIVLHEIETLKRRISGPDVSRRKMKKFFIRLVYIEMLGHDASFGYIHAGKMTHDDSLLLKRTGYLAVTLFLSEDHDLIILIVNTIQKDLRSDNYLVVCAALTAVCKLINEETIPAVLPQVVELHRFYQKTPAMVEHLTSNFRKVDKSLSFLDGFVQQSIEKGARSYLPESERSGMFNIENFRGQYQQETSSHALRFEAYELPKPAPVTTVPAASLSTSTTDLVPVPEPTSARETHQAPKMLPTSDVLSADVGVKLRLDGVQKKWSKPTYSSPSALSTSSTSATQKTANGVSHFEVGGSVDSRRKQHVEVPAEKQRLAASLFGASSSKTEKKPLSSGHKAGKGSHTRTVPPPPSEPSKEKPVAVVPSTPPPDLLDLGDEPAPASTAPSADPFMQLEGLLGPNSASSPVPSLNSTAAAGSKTSDLMSLYSDTPSNSWNSNGVTNTTATKKGPNPQDSIEKDATARQVGVTPTGNNPNLFRDLLG